MIEAQLALAHASKLAMLALLAGMVWRGRLAQCRSFSLYIVATLTGNILISGWPERFYTPSFWLFKQGVYDLLKMAIALELAYRATTAFPGAWRTARVVFPVLLLGTTLALGWLTPRGPYAELGRWQPGILTATVWLLTATALLVTWYHLPITEWQQAIMLGLAPYMLTFVTGLRLMERRGWTFIWAGVLDSFAWLLLMSLLAWAAWRRDRVQARELEEPLAA